LQEQSITKQKKLYERIRKELSSQPDLKGTENVIVQGISDILKKVDTAQTKEEIDAVFTELDKYIEDRGIKTKNVIRGAGMDGGDTITRNPFEDLIEILKQSVEKSKNEIDKIDLGFSPFISEEAQKAADKEKEMREKFNEMTKKELDEYIKINKDAKDKYIEIAKSTREIRFSPGDDTESEKQKSAREKKEREEAKKRQAAIQAEIENLKKLAAEESAVYLDKDNDYNHRMAALQTYYAYVDAIREKELEKEKAAYQVSEEQINAVTAAGDRKRTEDRIKHNADVEKIDKDHFDKLYEQCKESMDIEEAMYSENMQKALVSLSERYREEMEKYAGNENKLRETEKKYQKEREKIIYDTNMSILNNQLAFLENQLSLFVKDADMQKDIQEQIAKTKREIAKETADHQIEQNERAIDEMTTMEEEFNKFMSNNCTQAVMGIWEQVLDIANQYYEQQLQAIDDLEAREKKYYDDKLKTIEKNLEAGMISEEEAAAHKRMIEAEQMQKEEQYNERRKEMQKKQAVWQKAESIVQAIINTATAVTSALGVFPPPLGIALAAVVAALGTAQIGMIAAQKVPEYKKGTDEHPGGPAYVGDGGKAEMVILPGGKIWKTPDKKTLVDLPAGAEVLPDFKKAFENIASQPVMIYRKDEGRGETVILHDDVQRSLLKNNNEKLNAIHRSLGAIRKNTVYSSNRKIADNWIKNY
jgi:hypothetical protein